MFSLLAVVATALLLGSAVLWRAVLGVAGIARSIRRHLSRPAAQQRDLDRGVLPQPSRSEGVSRSASALGLAPRPEIASKDCPVDRLIPARDGAAPLGPPGRQALGAERLPQPGLAAGAHAAIRQTSGGKALSETSVQPKE